MKITLTRMGSLSALVLASVVASQPADAAITCIGGASFEYSYARYPGAPVHSFNGFSLPGYHSSGIARGFSAKLKRRRACRRAAREAYSHILRVDRRQICQLAQQRTRARLSARNATSFRIIKLTGFGREGSTTVSRSKRIAYRCP